MPLSSNAIAQAVYLVEERHRPWLIAPSIPGRAQGACGMFQLALLLDRFDRWLGARPGAPIIARMHDRDAAWEYREAIEWDAEFCSDEAREQLDRAFRLMRQDAATGFA